MKEASSTIPAPYKNHAGTMQDVLIPDSLNPITSNNGQNKFDLFWNVYPKKVEKKTAKQIWQRKHLDDKAEVLIADVNNRMKNDGRWLGGFIPDPTTYLSQERWEDELTPPNSKDTHGKPSKLQRAAKSLSS